MQLWLRLGSSKLWAKGIEEKTSWALTINAAIKPTATCLLFTLISSLLCLNHLPCIFIHTLCPKGSANSPGKRFGPNRIRTCNLAIMSRLLHHSNYRAFFINRSVAFVPRLLRQVPSTSAADSSSESLPAQLRHFRSEWFYFITFNHLTASAIMCFSMKSVETSPL